MTPAVFICNSIEELVRLSGAGEFIPLAGPVPMSDVAAKVLKATAPLCGENWRVYIERSDDGLTCRYGVFCGTTDPSALTVEEVVMDDYREGSPVIRMAQTAVNKVEVKVSTGAAVEFRFNADNDVDDLDNDKKVSIFASVISGADGQLQGYVERLLSAALRRSHGTLLAVISGDPAVLPGALEDCIILDPPLSLTERLQAHLAEGKTSGSVSRLQVATELVCGFVASDGITIFNSSGQVVAYRSFVRVDAAGEVNGGARTRAFATLSGLVGHGLDAAFFRSQDGRTEVKVLEGGAA